MTRLSRRDLLGHMSSGLGFMAASHLLKADGRLAEDAVSIDPGAPFAARSPHFEPRAKNVVDRKSVV